MPEANAALEMIERRLKELEEILKRASVDLNTVAGSEQVAQWKKRTIPMLAEHVGQKEAQRFAATDPGPSFTNDLLEELSDEVETYRHFLVELSEQLQKSG